MSQSAIQNICAAQAGAEKSFPFDETTEVWKVAGKIFAAVTGDGTKVSVKTPSVEDAQLLIEMGRGEKAPYFHKSWVRVSADIPLDELTDRIEKSYGIIRAALPKKVQATLA
ncbi:MmcQ/YjbR family DNA-binding protein [Aestuariibius sp. HNIBRBA575]|uniref:MmcQ/YjbR family DNA-binding protein n=1 Tax=Aestuariibius sp. HNIBRBA575 TaxID=3233343 RepID=UPI0034A43BF9